MNLHNIYEWKQIGQREVGQGKCEEIVGIWEWYKSSVKWMFLLVHDSAMEKHICKALPRGGLRNKKRLVEILACTTLTYFNVSKNSIYVLNMIKYT